MRPSRIVVGEVRAEECLDLLLALNSGLPGMATVHANSAREALVKPVRCHYSRETIHERGCILLAMSDRGIIYGRASRDPRGGGTSVSNNFERGRDFAKRENVEVIAEIRDDNRSASSWVAGAYGLHSSSRSDWAWSGGPADPVGGLTVVS